MSVAIVIPEKWEPSKLVLWSAAIARAGDEDLYIIRPTRQKWPVGRGRKKRLDVQTDASRLAAAIREHASDFHVRDLTSTSGKRDGAMALRKIESAGRSIVVVKLSQTELVADVPHLIKALSVRLLIVPRHRDVRIDKEDFAAERQLLLEAPCETLQLCPGKKIGANCTSILVGTNGGKKASPALSIGAKLAASSETKVTALYVDQNSNSVAHADGRKIVDRAVRKSLRKNTEIVTPVVIEDKDVPHGLSSYATNTGHDLIIIGGGGYSAGDQPSSTSISEKLLLEMNDPTVVVVRNAIPLTGRCWKLVERYKRYCIPQLDREGRVEVVQRLESAANWDFDFVFMICLATLIAALGLCLNSATVVIGAMLVAPLMTPMLGVGLSVVQGNRMMANQCLRTIWRGFIASFMTGCLVGLIRICFTSSVTMEMSSRGSPGIVDLFVAFVSGAVAAYAFGRPHLLSVLPGISIATALVPPVATVGLCLFAWEFDIALGASLLFLSNFVAIVLGSASSLWFVGMRGPREPWPSANWTQRFVFGLFSVTVCLSLYFTVREGLANVHDPAVATVDDADKRADKSPKDRQRKEDSAKRAGGEKTVRKREKPDQQADPPQPQQVHVVLKPRAADDGEPQMADVTLVVPSESQPVELTGIVAKKSNDGWVILDWPSQKPWKNVFHEIAEKLGFDSLDLCDLLQKPLEQEPSSDLAAPM